VLAKLLAAATAGMPPAGPANKCKPVRTELLRRGFGIETVCSKCQAPLRPIALIKTEASARKILDAMHLPSEVGPAHPTPAPRGFAAPVAKLHPARPPPGLSGVEGGEEQASESWLN
jgi:hypothetical protein